MDRPLRLTSIRLAPPPRTTRSSFLNAALKPFVSSSHLNATRSGISQPETLGGVLATTKAMVGHLDRFGIFDMDMTTLGLQPRRGGDPDEVELVVGLREKGRLFLKGGTDAGSGEGSAVSG
jgi:outer membrane protein insertion porin family